MTAKSSPFEPTVLLFGDPAGLPRLLRVLDRGSVLALVRAEIRPGQAEAVERLGIAHGISVFTQPRVHAPEFEAFVAKVRDLAPDLIVVDSYSMLVPPELLVLPSLGAVNVHHSALPKYRGPNPIQWAIIADEREAGVTLHHMTAEFDTGDVIAQRIVPVRFEDTWRDVLARLDVEAEAMLAEALPLVLDGTAPRRPQSETAATRSVRRRPEDGVIEWTASALSIYNLIRALVDPLPGARYSDSGEEVVLRTRLGIAEVIALKLGRAGGQEVRDGNLRLVTGESADEEILRLDAIDDRDGRCATLLLEVDWEVRTVLIHVESFVPAMGAAAVALGSRFAREELEIRDERISISQV